MLIDVHISMGWFSKYFPKFFCMKAFDHLRKLLNTFSTLILKIFKFCEILNMSLIPDCCNNSFTVVCHDV